MTRSLSWIWIALLATSVMGCSTTETTVNEEGEPQNGNSSSSNNSGSETATSDEDPVTIGADEDVQFEAPDEQAAASEESTWIPATGEFVLQDQQTGTLWNLRGEAYRGELAGERLKQLPAFNSFWFAWSAFYDGSELWNRDIKNTTGEIRTGDNCLVPCDEIRTGCAGGKDCIPALSHDGNGRMVEANSAEADYLTDNSIVLGVHIDGEARAYPHNILWWHEIFNDEIGDTEFAVTFCPLTGSGIVFEGRLDRGSVDFGVSGRLYNSNLVMYDRGADEDTFWAQMVGQGITGPKKGEYLERLPVVETTWAKWKKMHPDTLVTSKDTGHNRDYSRYPYADYRTDDSNTFRPTNPDYQDTYRAKDRVLGLVGDSTSRAYAFPEMKEKGETVVINDTFEDDPIVIVFEAIGFAERLGTAIPFSAEVNGERLTFVGLRAP